MLSRASLDTRVKFGVKSSRLQDLAPSDTPCVGDREYAPPQAAPEMPKSAPSAAAAAEPLPTEQAAVEPNEPPAPSRLPHDESGMFDHATMDRIATVRFRRGG
jgi:hypothetical protein